MEIMLDTCILIKAEKQTGIASLFSYQADDEFVISAMTVSEMMIGVHRADSEARKVKRLAIVETLLANLPIINFTSETAYIHAELFAYLAQKGQLIGAHDLIIAATALANNCKLMTYNHHEFARVPGLQLITAKDI